MPKKELPIVEARRRRTEAAKKAAAARWAGHTPKKRREAKAKKLPERAETEIHPLVRQLMQARELAGVAKRELARRAGLSKGHVDAYERGRIGATVLYTLNRLGAVLGLRLVWASMESTALAAPKAAIEESCAAMCKLCEKGVPVGRVGGKLRHVMDATDLPCKAAPIREKLLRQ